MKVISGISSVISWPSVYTRFPRHGRFQAPKFQSPKFPAPKYPAPKGRPNEARLKAWVNGTQTDTQARKGRDR
jgi:hypothetical protein